MELAKFKIERINKSYFATSALKTLLFSMTLLVGACAYNPATKSMNVVMMSKSQELKIGKEEHEKIMQGTPIYQDEEVVQYVRSIGQKVAKNSDRPNLSYQFNILDDPNINAFALPGGYIYITRGILSYLQSEAELAAVLAHEVGHVTARHAVRQDAQRKGASVATAVATIFTQSYDVGGATSLWLGAAVSGYGREMELEADGFGARYLYNSGYDPQAMVDVISTLKGQERFTRLKKQAQGQKNQTYHGVFSTHPRNDQRLRQIIEAAGKIPEDASDTRNENKYRTVMEGLVYGVNYNLILPNQDKEENATNRYIDDQLGITMVLPQDWQAENQNNTVVAEPEDKHAKINVEVDRLLKTIPPSEYIKSILGIQLLQKSEPIAQGGMKGHTGIIPAQGEGHPQRLAVFFQGTRVFIITGSVSQPKEGTDYDNLFMGSIRTLRPNRTARKGSQISQKIHYVRANKKTNYDALARVLGLGDMGADELRLLNGDYPRGEAEVGEWIKIIQ